MRLTGLAFLLTIFTVPAIVHADENLVLNLPSSHPKVEEPKAQPAPPARISNPALLGRSLPSRRSTAARNPMPEKVIGRLGVSDHTTSIRSSHSSRSRTLSQIPPGTYVALTKDAGDWYGVLMADRSTGWIRKRDVNVLDYEVMGQPQPERTRLADFDATGGAALLTGGGNSVLEYAKQFLGIPYKYGGTSASGIDCSAFVRTCFQAIGLNLPRTAEEQSRYGQAVPVENLQAADRLYFAGRSGHISHTGIYIGNGYFIHASSSRHGVAISRLTEPLYSRMFAGARR